MNVTQKTIHPHPARLTIESSAPALPRHGSLPRITFSGICGIWSAGELVTLKYHIIMRFKHARILANCNIFHILIPHECCWPRIPSDDIIIQVRTCDLRHLDIIIIVPVWPHTHRFISLTLPTTRYRFWTPLHSYKQRLEPCRFPVSTFFSVLKKKQRKFRFPVLFFFETRNYVLFRFFSKIIFLIIWRWL